MMLIRFVTGRLILFFDALFSPKPVVRSREQQAQLDKTTQPLSLYQFAACPFCVKVRRAIKRLNLKIELKDAKKNPTIADELVRGGGKLQVPCLKIQKADGSMTWMYESGDIIAYLQSLIKN